MNEERKGKQSQGGSNSRGGKRPPRKRGKRRGRSGNSKGSSTEKKSPALRPLEEFQIPKPITYGILFFDTFGQAKSSEEKLSEERAKVEQLNIVIKSDGDMDDPDLTKYGKIFAGEAWTLIHERRVEEGWYREPH